VSVTMRECCGGPKREPTRSTSLPSMRMIPSQDMGEYEDPNRRRSAPGPRRPRGGGLFPLNEEGEYGPPPSAAPKPLPGYQKRERKPKVYASYAVSSECDLHASKLEKMEKDKGNTLPRSRKSSRPSSRASATPSRSRATSSSPDRYRQSSSPDIRKRSVSKEKDSVKSINRKNSNNYSNISNYNSINNISNNNNNNYSAVKSIANSVKSQNGFSSSKYRSSSFSKVSRDLRESSFEENEEYEYQNKQNSKGGGGKISLDALREPEFDYDSMGILGLTSRMWNNTQTKKESFMKTSFMRKESFSSQVV